jgi:hypothetical protein
MDNEHYGINTLSTNYTQHEDTICTDTQHNNAETLGTNDTQPEDTLSTDTQHNGIETLLSMKALFALILSIMTLIH